MHRDEKMLITLSQPQHLLHGGQCPVGFAVFHLPGMDWWEGLPLMHTLVPEWHEDWEHGPFKQRPNTSVSFYMTHQLRMT